MTFQPSVSSRDPVTPVLAEDGAQADGGDYFLCLPANAKFVTSAGNQWGDTQFRCRDSLAHPGVLGQR